MNKMLIDLAPILCGSIQQGLESEGRTDLSSQVEKLIFQSWNYDSETGSVTVSVRGGCQLTDAEKRISGKEFGECVALDSMQENVVIDVSNVGRISGVEVIGDGDILRELQSIDI
jgi:uncharacterized protein YuzE